MPNQRITPEEIRSALVSTAKEKFLSNGIAGTEMKDIAASAGLSRSTLYRYMIDRNQLAFIVSSETCVMDSCCASLASCTTFASCLC